MLTNSVIASYFNLNTIEKELTWETSKIILNALAIVIVPHQDDESISMGGTIARLVDHGFKVYVIFIKMEKFNKTLNTDPKKRKKEALTAIGLLGVSTNNTIFLNHPDGDLKVAALNFNHSAGKLRSVIQKIEAQSQVNIQSAHTIILTTSRLDAHRDHEETFNLVKNAIRKHIIIEFPTVNHISSEFKPNALIDTSKYYSMKKTALKAYEGEISKRRILWDEIEFLDKFWGDVINADKAESCHISWFGFINTHT